VCDIIASFSKQCFKDLKSRPYLSRKKPIRNARMFHQAGPNLYSTADLKWEDGKKPGNVTKLKDMKA